MKGLDILCILLPLCSVHGDTLNRLKTDIANVKSSTETIINDLTHLENTLKSNTEKKFNALKLKTQKSIDGLTTSALEDVSTAVKGANRQGKKAGVCYVDAEKSLKTLSTNSKQQLNNCEKKNQKAIEPTVKAIDSAVQTGKFITYELDQLYLVCYSEDQKVHADCISKNLTDTRKSVVSLKSTALSLRKKERLASIEAYNVGKNCCSEAQTFAEKETSNVLVVASKCIKNAK